MAINHPEQPEQPETELEARLRRVRRALGIAEPFTEYRRGDYVPPAKAWPVPAHVIAALATDCSGWGDERINVVHSLILMLDDSDESAAAIKAECAGLVAELRRVHG